MGLERTRYFYRTEGKRRVTVAYQYDPQTGNTSYGASIFRQDFPGEIYVKNELRATAENRLRVAPVRLRLPISTYPEVENLLRRAIRVYGVKGERLVNSGKIAQPDVPEGVQVCIGLDPNWPGREVYLPYAGEPKQNVIIETDNFESDEVDQLLRQVAEMFGVKSEDLLGLPILD